MSINEQLVEDMESLVLSNPDNLINAINAIPTDLFKENLNKFEIAFMKRIGDINFITFRQLNDYTEPIINNELIEGEIILTGNQNKAEDYLTEEEYMIDCAKYNVSLIQIGKKVMDGSYKCKSIRNTGLRKTMQNVNQFVYNPRVIENIDVCENVYDYILDFHNNSWGFWCGAEYDGKCNCRKVQCFRKIELNHL